MTTRETIDALPSYKRAVVENLIAQKMKDNWIVRNAGVVDAIIAEVEAMDWSYFENRDNPAEPNPAAEEAPVEDAPVAGDE